MAREKVNKTEKSCKTCEYEGAMCYISDFCDWRPKKRIKALEQEPCEDCISRKAVLELSWELTNLDSSVDRVISVSDIDKLPSVTPTRKKGKWIKGSIEQGALGIRYTEKTCSKCGWSHSLIIPQNYCPNCGAEMENE